MRLRYTHEAIHSFPAGAPLLSLQLTVRQERFPNGVVRSFLDGLLPEGDARRAIAEDFGSAQTTRSALRERSGGTARARL